VQLSISSSVLSPNLDITHQSLGSITEKDGLPNLQNLSFLFRGRFSTDGPIKNE